MELHQLRYFCAVAEAGSFTRAAAREHVAQPSLSQQIIKLEDELGARLFERLARSVRLTDFGEAFLPRARSILRELGDAKTQIQEMAGSERGEITVGAIPTIAPYFLGPLVMDFARLHPSVQTSVVEDITPVLLRRLHEASLDVAVIALPVSGAELSSLELRREPLFLVVPEHHRLARARTARLEEVREDPFLLLKEGHCFRETAISACRKARMQPNVAFESGHFGSILALVAAGLGISIVPQMAVEPRPGCRFVRLADERALRRIGAVWIRHRYQTRAVAAFLEHLASTRMRERRKKTSA